MTFSARSVLAFGAHPDDLEVGAGGLLARYAKSGARVTMVVSSIPNRFAERLEEARAGAATLGAELVFVREHEASRLEDIAMHELVAIYDDLIARHTPGLVITHGPSDMHWDHTLVHRAVVSALRRHACDVLAYDASPALAPRPHPVGPCFADITDVIDIKLAAMAHHTSQLSQASIDARRDTARALGRMCGVTYAEVYEPLRIMV